jgi:hypothetical protein
MPSTDTLPGISARRQSSAPCLIWSPIGTSGPLPPHLSATGTDPTYGRHDNRATTSCLLCYLSSAYPQHALIFQFLIALDFSSHYMHMYRYLSPLSCTRLGLTRLHSSLVTGSKSHKLVTSEVSRILWFYYNDPVRSSRPTRTPFLTTHIRQRSSSFVPATNSSLSPSTSLTG